MMHSTHRAAILFAKGEESVEVGFPSYLAVEDIVYIMSDTSSRKTEGNSVSFSLTASISCLISLAQIASLRLLLFDQTESYDFYRLHLLL